MPSAPLAYSVWVISSRAQIDSLSDVSQTSKSLGAVAVSSTRLPPRLGVFALVVVVAAPHPATIAISNVAAAADRAVSFIPAVLLAGTDLRDPAPNRTESKMFGL